MEKLQFMRLWDLYGGLLTPTQREITSMYFELDLTVSEIADEKGVSRQSISECLGLCKRQLFEYEQKLGLSSALEERDSRLKDLEGAIAVWAAEFLQLHPEYAADIANLTTSVLGKKAV